MELRVKATLALLTALLVIPASAQGQAAAGFEPAGAGLPLYRPAGAAAVVAVATPQWVPVPTDPHDLLGAYRFLPPYATDDTEGQVFRLLFAEKGTSVADPEGNFVAVPWTVGCGCAEEGWDEPIWVQPGDTVVFLLSKTRNRVPWSGPPVFDVLGWHQPYPAGEFIPFWRWAREEPENWLSVEEFFQLLKVLPTEAAFQLDPGSALTAVRGWLALNPGKESTFPIPTMLRELDRLTEVR
ncbi:MAG: hypothetical protein HKO65_04615 [Gemmatimonadetes bacterium]|nr:hypothetical protein [Gemmatimonadota bacterium]NNM04363.1 hypothetical protein [Gemmatimonadota bacterium]